MSHAINRLSKTRVAALERSRTPGLYCDGGSLWLQITPKVIVKGRARGGSASWLFWYERGGKRHKLGLGPLPLITVEEARAKRDELKKQLLNGQDPLAKKAAEKAKAAQAMTFRQAAEAFIKMTAARRGNQKSVVAWHMTLLGQTPESEPTENNYCKPILDLPIDDIDNAAVLRVLEPIWTRIPETARRLRARIEQTINFAIMRGWATDRPNPASWRKRLEHALPRERSAGHHKALPYESLPDFMAKLRTREGLAARGFELLILCACRTGDVRKARREQFDLEARVWTIPRTKTNVEHRVPLSDAAIALMTRVLADAGDGHVFEGDKPGEPMSDGAMLRVRDRMIADELVEKGVLTVHGMRAAFKSWAGDETTFERDVIEACLSHAIGDPLEKAYRRTDFLEKRRRLMGAWADFVMGKKASANVIDLHAHAAQS
jgi:integrase